MSRELGRREVLRKSAGIAAGAGLMSLAGLAGPARAAGVARLTRPAMTGAGLRGQSGYPYPYPFPFPEPDPVLDLPPVPGMLGDRRANEVWYELDQKSLYQQGPGIREAYREIAAYVGPQKGGEVGVLLTWLAMSRSAGYPRNYAAWAAPIRAPLAFISGLMLGNFGEYYGRRSPNLTRAFAYFGQGVLYDPRRVPGDRIHDMDATFGYAVLHAYARAFMVLGLAPDHWREIIPLNAFACALQLIANPGTSEPSPPLPRAVILREAWATLPLGPRQLDTYFQEFPYPPNLGALTVARPAILRG
jgi:hypothetical protein